MINPKTSVFILAKYNTQQFLDPYHISYLYNTEHIATTIVFHNYEHQGKILACLQVMKVLLVVCVYQYLIQMFVFCFHI